MRVKIEIDTKTFIRFWLTLLGLALAGLMIWRAKDALVLLIISAFLALALNGPVTRIAKILPGSSKNRVGATAVAYLAIVVVLGLIVSFLGPMIIDQTGKFISQVPDFFKEVTASNSGVRLFIKENHLENLVEQASKSLNDLADTYSKNIGNIIFGSIASLANFLVSLFLILTMAFLMLVEGPSWFDKLWKMYPDKTRQKRHKRIAYRMYRAVANYINGQLTVCAISGTLAAITVAIIALITNAPVMNLAIPVGVILFIFGMIPMFGAALGGVLSAMILAFNIWYVGLIFAVYFLIYQQIENNLISPMIQARSNQLSALIIIVAITVGIYAAGLLGAFLSIPTAACLKILFEEFYLARRKKKPEEDKETIAKFLKSI